MKRLISSMFCAAIAATLSFSATADTQRARKASNSLSSTIPAIQKTRSQSIKRDKRNDIPRRLPVRNNGLSRFITDHHPVNYIKAHRSPQENEEIGVTLRAGVVYSSAWSWGSYRYGVYELPQTQGGDFKLLTECPEINYGGSLVDGIYYAVNYDLNTDVTTVRGYDPDTWKMLSEEQGSVGLSAWDTAVDPVTGRVYGCFFADDGYGYVFGYADYKTLERTAICDLEEQLTGIAADAKGNIYGINRAGILYSIDKATGEMTIIGDTGAKTYFPTSATIDIESGRFFYAVNDIGNSALYEIDPATGNGTVVMTFPDEEELCGLYAVPPLAADGAPAAVSNLKVEFDGKSLEGTVSFTAPSTCYNGEPGSGDLLYEITVGGTVVDTKAVDWGQEVTAPLSIAAAGEYTIGVTASNSTGKSPEVKQSLFIGPDVPTAPHVSLSRENDVFTVKWETVTKSVNGGYINADGITYTVVRYPDAVTVAQEISATSFTETIAEPKEFTTYYYEVTAVDDDIKSAPGVSNTISLGSATLPFSESFDTADALDKFTIIDGNSDRKQWHFDETNQAAVMDYNEDLKMDDWLLTPAFRLEAGKIYTLKFIAYNRGSYPERIEVKMGTEPVAASMTQTILEPTIVKAEKLSPLTVEKTFIPSADGIYFIGFHGISDADSFCLYIDDISVSAPFSDEAPAAVTDLQVTPDPSGAHSAVVSFNAPTTSVSGATLSAIDFIEISRDDTVVKTFTSPAPGEALSYTDSPIEPAGEHTWKVIAATDNNYGLAASVSAFVGINIPGRIAAVLATETANTGEVSLSWEAPETDINGNPTNPDVITYNIYLSTDYESELVVEGLTATNYTYRLQSADAPQDFFYWEVYPVTEAGEGRPQYSNMVAVGPADECPYHESFADRKVSHPFAVTATGNAEWDFYGDNNFNGLTSQDHDNGMAALYCPQANEYAILTTGKIKLPANNPALSFYTYNLDNDDDNELEISVIENGVSMRVKTIIVNTTGEIGAWNHVTVPLNAFAGKTVQLDIKGTILSYTLIFLDNITIGELTDYDLAVAAISAPERVKPGQEFNVDVKIENLGINAAGSYTVYLTDNDEKIASADGTGLLSGAATTFRFPVTLSLLDETHHSFSAEIDYSADNKTENNTCEPIEVTLVLPGLPAVTGLTAATDNGAVTLSWEEPDLSTAVPEPYTEDFENGETWSKSFADWTFLDLDGETVGGMEETYIPGLTPGTDTASFFIFDSADPQFAHSSFEAFSGKKYMASLFNYMGTAVNDWAISPLLYGKAQTISFYAKSYDYYYPESIEVLYSTGSLNPEDFITLKKWADLSQDWVQFSADLPDGAKYFAIRSYATNAFMLMIDDVTFIPASAAEDLSLMGYNIYRDGEKINSAPVEDTSWFDNDAPAGVHRYSVTAIYDRGESPAAHVSAAMSAIDNIDADAAISITAGHGELKITGAVGMPIAVYTLDGKTIHATTGATCTTIPLPAGIYIVKAASTVTKVIVR